MVITNFYKMEAKKKSFIEQLHRSFGNISKASNACGISRQTYYEWLKNDEEFKMHVENIDEYILDRVEESLHDQIQNGNTTATIFFLKTKGKKRGYFESIDINSQVEIKSKPEWLL